MLTQVLVPILAFLAVTLIGTGIVLLFQARRSRITNRLEDNERLRGWDDEPRRRGSGVERLAMGMGSAMAPEGGSSNLRKEMVRAGFRGASAPVIFLGIKFILLFLSIIAVVVIVSVTSLPLHIKTLIGIVTVGLAFFAPNIVTEILARKRTAKMRQSLPDMVDLLEVCVSGGMGLDQAWISVSEEIRTVSPLLGDEMALTNLEINLGEERGEAIRQMAERTGLEDLSSLVATLVQSERFGTSIAEALIVFAENLREIRSMRAEEEAEKMAVKMLFPMICFIFPVELIIAVGPAALTLIDLLGSS